MESLSPWLDNLEEKITAEQLLVDHETDIVIIGGGISGTANAYELLTKTGKKVTIVESRKFARGATGNNAGIALSFLEKPIEEIAEEYGETLAYRSLRFLETGWDVLDEMIEKSGSTALLEKIWGLGAFTLLDDFIEESTAIEHFLRAGCIHVKGYYCLEEYRSKIPASLTFCTFVTPEELHEIDPFSPKGTIGITKVRCGIINSAQLVHDVLGYLHKKYPTRVRLFENSTIDSIWLNEGKRVILRSDEAIIHADTIILATNGYEGLTIVDKNGSSIADDAFHNSTESCVAFMNGYLTTEATLNTRYISSTTPQVGSLEIPYWYYSQRKLDGGEYIAIGGPEVWDDKVKAVNENIERAAHELINEKADELFPSTKLMHKWKGVMGYTASKLRLVGAHPQEPRLIYNIGCNGIGIIPALASGKRIAEGLNGKTLEPLIFNPEVQEQVLEKSS